VVSSYALYCHSSCSDAGGSGVMAATMWTALRQAGLLQGLHHCI
jgi:hypothetical protein